MDMYAFHVEVPKGVSEIDIEFDDASSPNPKGRTSHASATPEIATLNWSEVPL